MARHRTHAPALLARSNATGFPLLHIEMLHDSLKYRPDRAPVADWDVEAERLYQSALSMAHTVCVHVEALSADSILFGQAGEEACRHMYRARLAFVSLHREKPQRIRVKSYFEVVRARLSAMVLECSAGEPSIPALCAEESFAAADIAESIGMTGSDFLEYLHEFQENAYKRLAILKALKDYGAFGTPASSNIDCTDTEFDSTM
jgi:hypothetical protein